MLTAALGLAGVLVGAFVSQSLSASWQRRRERLEALVALVAANARVIGSHERLHGLLSHCSSPPVASEHVQQALIEHGNAHGEWRTAHARAAILIPGHEPLDAAMERFRIARAAATVSLREYQRLGPDFSFADYSESEHKSWLAMHGARVDLIAAGQAIVLEDARWLPVLRKQRRKRSYRRLASLAAARGVAADAAPGDSP